MCRRRVTSGGQKKDGVKKLVLQCERMKELRKGENKQKGQQEH